MKEKRKNLDLDIVRNEVIAFRDAERARRESNAAMFFRRVLRRIANGKARYEENGNIKVTLWSRINPHECENELRAEFERAGFRCPGYSAVEYADFPFRYTFTLKVDEK